MDKIVNDLKKMEKMFNRMTLDKFHGLQKIKIGNTNYDLDKKDIYSGFYTYFKLIICYDTKKNIPKWITKNKNWIELYDDIINN